MSRSPPLVFLCYIPTIETPVVRGWSNQPLVVKFRYFPSATIFFDRQIFSIFSFGLWIMFIPRENSDRFFFSDLDQFNGPWDSFIVSQSVCSLKRCKETFSFHFFYYFFAVLLQRTSDATTSSGYQFKLLDHVLWFNGRFPRFSFGSTHTHFLFFPSIFSIKYKFIFFLNNIHFKIFRFFI